MEEFGPGVLADPPASGFDLAAYLVPILLVLAAVAGIAVAARRWRRQAARPPPRVSPWARRTRAGSTRELAAYDRR